MSSKNKIYLLHGWSVNQRNKDKWLPLITSLEKKGFKPVFLAIPGLSSPLNEVWKIDDFIDWLSKELPQKEKVVLLGHSFGGHLAIRFSALYPDRVKKLILVDSSGIRDQSLVAKIKRASFWLAAKVGKFLFRMEIARKLLYLIARERDYYSAPPLLRRTMSLILDDEIADDLEHITAPTLIIWGADDKVTPLKIARQKQQRIPDAELKIIKGARHSPQFTHVEQVAKEVQHFV